MATDETYKFGDYVLYVKRYLLTHKGNPLSLPPRLFDTLLCLLRSAGTPVPKELITKTVWLNQHVSETNITRAIADLRKVLRDSGRNIKTVPGVGYCFVGPVQDASESHSSHITETLSLYSTVSDKAIRLISVLPFLSIVDDNQLGKRCSMATATELSVKMNLPVGLPGVSGYTLSATTAEATEISHFLVACICEEGEGRSVYVHLWRAEGRIVWATRFVIPIQVEDLPNYIAQQISRRLNYHLKQPSTSLSSSNSKAAHLHGRALFHWRAKTISGLHQGLKYAEDALKADPSFAQAHVTAATYYCALVPYGDSLPSELLLKAGKHASRALELDPYLADAHVSLGIIKLRHEFDRVAAENSFRNAVALEPRNCVALYWLGNVQCTDGRFIEASDTLREAYEMNPKSLSIRVALAQALFLANDLQSCREWLEEVLELSPTFAPAEFGMGMVYGWEGDKKNAMHFLQQASEHSGGRTFYLSSLAFGASKWSNRRTIKTILSHLNFRRERRYVPYYDLAVTQLAEGNLERAVQSMKRAIASRDALAPWLGVDPRVQALTSSPEFESLLQEVGLCHPLFPPALDFHHFHN